MIYKITPVAKPRMTQTDKWKKRPATTKYWQYKDDIRKLGIKLPESNFWVKFYIPMPNSWSKKKKSEYNLKPHQCRPDKDNLEKALYDAVLDEDCKIWDSRVTKLWAYEGAIEIITNCDQLNVNS